MSDFDGRAEKPELLRRGLGPHGLHQGLGTQDGDHTLQIVGQNVEAHLCSDLFEGSGLEVGGAHPGLEGAERLFDGRAADAHALRRAVQPVLHGVDYGLMLPALDPASYPFSILKLSGISSHVANVMLLQQFGGRYFPRRNSRRIVSRLKSIRFWIVRSQHRSCQAMTVRLVPVAQARSRPVALAAAA